MRTSSFIDALLMRSLVVAALVFSSSSGACAMRRAPTDAPPSRPPHADRSDKPADFEIKWTVRDFDGNLLATDTSLPIGFDIITLYQREVGLFLKGGPHTMVEDPDWLRRHLRRVESDVAERVPAGFDGLVCIDYEEWGTIAKPEDVERMIRTISRAAPAFKDLPRERQTEIAKSTYRQRAREFYLETLRTCQRVRPRAEWGYWNRPLRGTLGMTTKHADQIRERNDELDWLMEAVDVVFPVIYPRLYLISEDEEAESARHVGPSRFYEIQRSIVEEAVRVSKGKPVYPYMSLRAYPRVDGKPVHGEMLTAPHMIATLRAAIDADADGVIIWGGKHDDRPGRIFQQTVLEPAMRELGLLDHEPVRHASPGDPQAEPTEPDAADDSGPPDS